MQKLTTLLLLASIAVLATAQSPSDPKQILSEIYKVRSQAAQDQKDGKAIDAAAIAAKIAEMARQGVAGVDADKVQPEQASDWGNLFRMAKMPKEAGLMAVKATRFYTMQAWMAQQDLFANLVAEGKGKEAVNVLRYAIASEVTMLAQFGDSVHYTLTPKYIKTDPQLVLEAYDALLLRMNPSVMTAPADRQWADVCYATVSAHRCEALYAMGRKDEAQATLKKLKARFAASTSKNAYGQTPTDAIDQVLNSWGVTSTAAPKLTFQKTIGTFPGLEGLRGKVVLLDFFAHWCGPCKRGFPELRELYATYRGKGMELVGVTSYYGYYGAKQGIKADEEYELMKGFVKEMDITWPVAFDATSSSMKAYKVGAIPHLAIVDRKGVLRMVQIGYSLENGAKVRAFVEKLLAEKA